MIVAIVASFRHLLGWAVSALSARENLVLENMAIRQQLLALHAMRPRHRLTAPHKLFWVALLLWYAEIQSGKRKQRRSRAFRSIRSFPMDTFDMPVPGFSATGLPVQSARHVSISNFYSHATFGCFRAVRRSVRAGECSGALAGLTGSREPLPAEAAGKSVR